MTTVVISDELREQLEQFLKKYRHPDLIQTYLYYVEKKFGLHPVVCLPEKMIYQNAESAIAALENEGKLWRETEIKIGYSPPSVNAQTKKIYICPFTGKVFGDNTHPHPQDAIYDWVSQCPENTERINGVKVKRFFVSEDSEVIKNYVVPTKQPVTKTVFSSALSGKLFHSKEAVIEDFKKNYLKDLSLVEVQNQNRFQIEEGFLTFIKKQLEQPKIAAFVEALAGFECFLPYVSQWIEEG